MIQGLMMTPPVVGRIAIGKVVERNGKRLPEKDDEFTITTQVQNRAGWVLHPMDAALRLQLTHPANPANSADAQMSAHSQDMQVQEPEPLCPRSSPDSSPSAKASLQSKLAKRAKAQGAFLGPLNQQTSIANAAHAANAGTAATAAMTDTARPTPASPKLRSIPVRLLFNDPSLNLRAAYTLFDRATARPICVGDGESCKRVRQGVVESHPCPGPDHCALGIEGNCKLFGRFHVRIDHPANQVDACSTFVLRTTGINTVRTLMARMQYFQAISGGLLAYLPLELRLRGKSTAQSRRSPIYYVDLCIRQSLTLEAAVHQAREAAEHARSMGLDQTALDAAARAGYAQGLFAETGEEAADVLQEFYPAQDQNPGRDNANEHDQRWSHGQPRNQSRNRYHGEGQDRSAQEGDHYGTALQA